MKPSENLFELIRTLTPSEKRFFRMYASRQSSGNDKNYLRLFEAISDQDEYDEEDLKSRFKGEGLEKHFANVKRYLYRLVLESMRYFGQYENERFEIYGYLKDGEYLWNKGLYDQSVKRYQLAARNAARIGAFDLELEALHAIRLERVTRQTRKVMDMIDDLESKSRQALRRLNQLTELRLQYFRLFALARCRYDHRDPEIQDELEQLKSGLIAKNDQETPDFFVGQTLTLQIAAVYSQMTGDTEEAYSYRKAIVKHWENHPEEIVRDQYNYSLALSNFLAGMYNIGRYDDCQETIRKLQAIPARSPDEKAEIFQNAYYFELLWRINCGELEKGLELVRPIEEGLELYADKVNDARLLAFWYNLLVLFFLLEDHSRALEYLKRIMHDRKSEHRQDLQQSARLLQIILHYELGNQDIMEHLFRSAYRFLYARDRIFDFEKIILEFLRKLSYSDSLELNRQVLKDLHDKLLSLPETSAAPGKEEILYWLKSKLEERSIHEVVLESIRP